MSVLVIAEHDNASIKGATLNTVTAAAACGGDVHVLVAGENAGAAAQAAAQIAGVAKVIHADGASLKNGLAENVAAQVLAIAGNYSHILFPATAGGKNVAPRVAAKLDVAQISDITKVVSADTFERPIYAGNAIATVQSCDATKVITVRTTGFDATAATGGNAAVETPTAAADTGKSSYVGSEIAKSDRPELTAAKIIVSGGRALGSKEKFDEVITPLADKLGAAIGASRAAVDAGYAPNDLQVGQTGKIVAPQLYVAAGISGAIQHLAGMKDSKVIVAINKDPEAPIFSVADYGLEADLFAAVPELVKAFNLDEIHHGASAFALLYSGGRRTSLWPRSGKAAHRSVPFVAHHQGDRGRARGATVHANHAKHPPDLCRNGIPGAGAANLRSSETGV